MNQLASNHRLEKWLRNKLRLEMLLQGLAGFFVSILAVFIMALMASLVSALIFVTAGDPLQPAFFEGLQVGHGDWLILVVVFLVILGLSFLGAYKIRQQIDYSGLGRGFPRNIDHHFFDVAADLGGEIFLAGPQLIVRAEECSGRILRLARIDVAQVASIILWLLERGHKASMEEISVAFPELNLVAVLPQLRDIPGVIWLMPRRGVVLLSRELQDELSRLLGRPRRRVEPEFASYANVPPEESPPEPPQSRPEVLQWYQTLGLPAFASIQDVKKRYRQLAKKYHPDATTARGGAKLANSEERMKRINFAYHEILKSSHHG